MVRNFIRFRSSIYGRVVFIITGSLIIVFILFNLVFRSVYMDFYNRTISSERRQHQLHHRRIALLLHAGE